MSAMRAILAVAFALTLAACGTRYQEMGFTGGVAAEQVTTDTDRIIARGNVAHNDTGLCIAQGRRDDQGGRSVSLHLSALQTPLPEAHTTQGSAHTTFSGGTAYTTYRPGETVEFVKPGQDAYIRGERPPESAISADEIIQFVGARVKRA